MKLMDIDSDSLAIPETEYEARVTMSSSEFTRIVRDLSQLGESVRIEVSKEGVRFASEGEAANGSVLLRQAEGATISSGKITAAKEEEVDEEEEGEGSTSEKKEKKKVKKEKSDDVEMVDGEEEKEDDDEGEEEKEDEEVNEEEDEEEDGSSKKRKKKVTSCKIVGDSDFHVPLSPGKRRYEAKQKGQN